MVHVWTGWARGLLPRSQRRQWSDETRAPRVVPGSGAVVTLRSGASPATWRMALISEDLPAFWAPITHTSPLQRQRGGGRVRRAGSRACSAPRARVRGATSHSGTAAALPRQQRPRPCHALDCARCACTRASSPCTAPLPPPSTARAPGAHRLLQVCQQLAHAPALDRGDEVHGRGARQPALRHAAAHPALRGGRWGVGGREGRHQLPPARWHTNKRTPTHTTVKQQPLSPRGVQASPYLAAGRIC